MDSCLDRGLGKPHYFLHNGMWRTYLTVIASHDPEAFSKLQLFLWEQKWHQHSILSKEWCVDRGPFGNGIGWRYVVFLLEMDMRYWHPATQNRSTYESLKEPDRLVHKLFSQVTEIGPVPDPTSFLDAHGLRDLE